MPSVFPTLRGLSWPVKRHAEFNNTRVRTNSGRSSVTPNRVLPIYHYELSFEILRNANGYTEYQQLLNLYLSTLGGARIFYFNDLDDNTVTNQTTGIGDGVTTQFEFVRTIPVIGFAEPVRAFNGTPTVLINGSPSGSFTIDAQGLINFTGAPANGAVITWSGQFYWCCRFDEDMLPLDKMMSTYWECNSVKFSTELFG